jgi:hypothetical protein
MRSVIGHPSPPVARSSAGALDAGGGEISLRPQPLQNFAPSRFSV